jgi:hypothetical protein
MTEPVWDRPPKAGSKWYRRATNGVGFVVNYPAETRHVVDRTLGGHVIFVSGRLTRFAYREQVTLEEWNEWVHALHFDAVEISEKEF